MSSFNSSSSPALQLHKKLLNTLKHDISDPSDQPTIIVAVSQTYDALNLLKRTPHIYSLTYSSLLGTSSVIVSIYLPFSISIRTSLTTPL